MKKIYAVVTINISDNNSVSYIHSPNDHAGIYDCLMKATNSNHEISANVESWCKFACIGDYYEVSDSIVVAIEEIELYSREKEQNGDC